MGLGNLTNCPNCGQLFVKGLRSVCQNCYKEVEKQFQLVYTFVRNKENRKSTITEVSQATGVTVSQIREFIREGRLRLAEFPNLVYPCDRCGQNMISQGNLCDQCKKFIDNEIRLSLDDEYRRQEMIKKSREREGFLNKN